MTRKERIDNIRYIAQQLSKPKWGDECTSTEEKLGEALDDIAALLDVTEDRPSPGPCPEPPNGYAPCTRQPGHAGPCALPWAIRNP